MLLGLNGCPRRDSRKSHCNIRREFVRSESVLRFPIASRLTECGTDFSGWAASGSKVIASCAQIGSQRQRCRNHNRLRLRTFSITAHYRIDVSFSRASETVASRHGLLPEKNGPLIYVYGDRSADGNGRGWGKPGSGPLLDAALKRLTSWSIKGAAKSRERLTHPPFLRNARTKQTQKLDVTPYGKACARKFFL
jgi:hypothetical protein